MKNWMNKIHHFVESVYLILKKAVIENPYKNICVKDDFFLHALDLHEIKTSGIFQDRFCKLEICIELL